MKLGVENRKMLIAACALTVVAVGLGAWSLGLLGGGSSSAAAPAAASSSSSLPETLPASAPKSHGGGKKPVSGQSLDPTLRFDLLKGSEDTKYEGAGRDVFRVFVVIEKPKAPIVTDHPAVAINQGPPPPPPPPPIDLKFYGFAISKPGESKRIFLIQGEDVFIAKEGDIVDRRYKVVRISPNAVEILDVLSNNRQSIPLSG